MNNIENLINLIKRFEGKPEMFANYLLLWDAFKGDFKKRVENSSILQKNSDKEFKSIKDIVDFYQNIFDNNNIDKVKTKKTSINIEYEYNKKLNECLINEDYETAAVLRDLMIKNNIKKY